MSVNPGICNGISLSINHTSGLMLDDNACDVVYMFMLRYVCGKGGWALSVNWTRRGNTHAQ